MVTITILIAVTALLLGVMLGAFIAVHCLRVGLTWKRSEERQEAPQSVPVTLADFYKPKNPEGAKNPAMDLSSRMLDELMNGPAEGRND